MSPSIDIDWKLKPILRAVDLVEEHIHEPIRVGDMADAAGYSVFHFCRCFNSLTRHSPYDYQMKRKLTAALAELQTGGESITSVAMDHGFDTLEGFSRAFRKMFGILPSAVRSGEVPDPRLSLRPLTEAYLRDLKNFQTKPEQVPFDSVELGGTAGHHRNAAELLSRFQFETGAVVVDYQPGWETRGMRVLIEEQGRYQLRADVEGGIYAVFSLDTPVTGIDSFLEYLFSVFCRRSGGPAALPDRVVFDIVEGMMKNARIRKL